ncbi:MAG: DnaA regulatory inactivator Hda [Burkholderiaceae bacterium]|jgi:DnaA family protein|nr:DnaA regulatory inactivator Hda [Burkholderiaceae bacterium]
MKQLALDIGLATGPTFDSFCAGPNAAALSYLRLWASAVHTRVAQSPAPAYAYLWGETGSGKTHLLQAVYGALRQQGARIGWLHPDVCTPPAFDEGWTAVLMDDMERFSALQQHAAFNWFVNAQSLQRSVIAAGALPPADLPLREDLRSRMGWGDVFHLQPLSESERRAVLHQASSARGIVLSNEVIDYMLRRFSRDLGSLMALLDQLDDYALRTQRTITIPLIHAMLGELQND